MFLCYEYLILNLNMLIVTNFILPVSIKNVEMLTNYTLFRNKI